MKTIAFNLGKDAKAYIEGSTSGYAALEELKAVQNGKVVIETAEAETTTREGAGWGSSTPTIRKATVELHAMMKVSDSVLETIEDAVIAGGVIEGAFLTGARDTAGSRGPYGWWMITSFARDEPIEGVVPVDVSLKLQEFIGYTKDGSDPTPV